MLLTFATFKKFRLFWRDVKSEFLNGFLNEKVFQNIYSASKVTSYSATKFLILSKVYKVNFLYHDMFWKFYLTNALFSLSCKRCLDMWNNLHVTEISMLHTHISYLGLTCTLQCMFIILEIYFEQLFILKMTIFLLFFISFGKHILLSFVIYLMHLLKNLFILIYSILLSYSLVSYSLV